MGHDPPSCRRYPAQNPVCTANSRFRQRLDFVNVTPPLACFCRSISTHASSNERANKCPFPSEVDLYFWRAVRFVNCGCIYDHFSCDLPQREYKQSVPPPSGSIQISQNPAYYGQTNDHDSPWILLALYVGRRATGCPSIERKGIEKQYSTHGTRRSSQHQQHHQIGSTRSIRKTSFGSTRNSV